MPRVQDKVSANRAGRVGSSQQCRLLPRRGGARSHRSKRPARSGSCKFRPAPDSRPVGVAVKERVSSALGERACFHARRKPRRKLLLKFDGRALVAFPTQWNHHTACRARISRDGQLRAVRKPVTIFHIEQRREHHVELTATNNVRRLPRRRARHHSHLALIDLYQYHNLCGIRNRGVALQHIHASEPLGRRQAISRLRENGL